MCPFCVVCFVFKEWSHSVVEAVLDSLCSPDWLRNHALLCVSFPNAGITGMSDHAPLKRHVLTPLCNLSVPWFYLIILSKALQKPPWNLTYQKVQGEWKDDSFATEA